METDNYLKLRRFSLRFHYYCFFDVTEYFADVIFVQNKVRVKFIQEYKHKDYPYLVIFCRILKKDDQQFLDALERLKTKMLLCGYPGYEDFCSDFISRAIETKGKM